MPSISSPELPRFRSLVTESLTLWAKPETLTFGFVHAFKFNKDAFLMVTNICFPLFILLPCKLLHVCLRNEFLIKPLLNMRRESNRCD